ncbi:CPBP family intramembrane metalloprotease domain-containing protein [Parenemella sanctibonifatiensis]|uniref:CPBP family intramembrane metalloprotease domain-containing protein n=2 Tax=Parenemella sanctibonifatiensis TaxID=2016505 RepID=A0A255E5F9_9ACTN|nr:CPBP family intramembrane metalloprotease domain-containing protein [Parenemella sanctibonifatiensis]
MGRIFGTDWVTPVNPDHRRGLTIEVVLVLAVSLGHSAVRSILNFIRSATNPEPISQQTTRLNVAVTPDRPWLDILYQLEGIVFGLAPAALALFLLYRRGAIPTPSIGFNLKRPGFDLGWGTGMLVLVGVPGLAVYLAARAMGLNLAVAASNLADEWWNIPIMILSALQAGILEEVVVLGYVCIRLRQVGHGWWLVLAVSALLRASYHLYQGPGGFVGNLLMGALFVVLFARWRRVGPMVVVHTWLDIVAFVGYALQAGVVDWL